NPHEWRVLTGKKFFRNVGRRAREIRPSRQNARKMSHAPDEIVGFSLPLARASEEGGVGGGFFPALELSEASPSGSPFPKTARGRIKSGYFPKTARGEWGRLARIGTMHNGGARGLLPIWVRS